MAGALAGRVALVTGARQGIGRAIALRLAADGARVAVNDEHDDPVLRALAEHVGGVAAPGDVADPAAVDAAVATTEAALGPVDVLVANAASMAMAPLTAADPAEWWRLIEVNLGGTWHTAQRVVPAMRRRGSGRIVVISSEWGVTGWPNASGYAASKAALIALTKTLGRELAPAGILVNAIAPGVIDTPQLEVDARDAGVSLDEIRRRYAEQSPLRRIGTPEEVAAAVAFLAGAGAGAFAGQVLQPNGGTLRCQA